MTGFWGLDVEAAQAQSKRMQSGSERLSALDAALRAVIASVTWEGHDAVEFRRSGTAVLARLTAWIGECSTSSALLRAQAEEQERASAVAGTLGSLPVPVPVPVRVPGSGAVLRSPVLRAGLSHGLDVGTYDDPDDDIAPILASDMQSVEGDDLIVPDSLFDIVRNIESVSQGQSAEATSIRVQEILGADGETRYIVYIPGSFGEWGHIAQTQDIDANPFDWNQNIGAYSGADTDSRQAVLAAMAAAGVPEGAQVVLAGHSQGGIVAAQLAADDGVNGATGGYDITGVVSVGSPVENVTIPAGTSSVNFANAASGGGFLPPNGGDPVPAIDNNPGLQHPLADTGGHQEIYLPSPLPGHGFENHDIGAYTESVGAATGSAAEAIAAFEQEAAMQDVLGQGNQAGETVDVAVSRAEGTYMTQEEFDEMIDDLPSLGDPDYPILP